MSKKQFSIYFNKGRECILMGLILCSSSLHASFIESSMGAAVIDDATATYYNPAALTRLKKPQFITLGSIGKSHTQFSGQSTQLITHYTQSGVSDTYVNDFLPSFYFAMPVTTKILAGVAVVANELNGNIDQHSILRYAQSNNSIKDIDVVPALGYKFNDFFSVGVALNRSRANFLLQPISGIPSLNIPDSQSSNESSGNAWGSDMGVLLRPGKATALGFNYRSAITYEMKGKSTFNGQPTITSNRYRFTYWTPARSVFSISQGVTPELGFIGTIQFIQWSIFKNVTLHEIATRSGILPSSIIHYNLHDTWLLTLGSNYRFSSKWVVRAAGSYTQSPSNGKFQIDTGDSITIGTSIGYTIFDNIIIDCSYAHAFVKNQDINASTAQNSTNGINKGERNAFALKLTVNV